MIAQATMVMPVWLQILTGIAACGFLGWAFRVERVLTRVATKLTVLTDHDDKHSIPNRLDRHSDKIDENSAKISKLEDRVKRRKESTNAD